MVNGCNSDHHAKKSTAKDEASKRKQPVTSGPKPARKKAATKVRGVQ